MKQALPQVNEVERNMYETLQLQANPASAKPKQYNLKKQQLDERYETTEQAIMKAVGPTNLKSPIAHKIIFICHVFIHYLRHMRNNENTSLAQLYGLQVFEDSCKKNDNILAFFNNELRLCCTNSLKKQNSLP